MKIGFLRKISGAIFGFSIIVVAQAETQCPPTPQVPSQKTLTELKAAAKNRGFLWQFSKNGRTSYLYGTLHVGKLEWAFPGPVIVDALGKSDTIALELDLTDSPTSQSLTDFSHRDAGSVPDEFKPRLKKLMAATCMPEALLESLNPVILFSTLELFLARFDGLEAGYGVESVLTGYALGAKKPVIALETAESQIAALLGPSGTISSDEIEVTLQMYESQAVRKVLQRLAGDWAQNNLDDLRNYVDWCDCMNTDEKRAEMKRLVDDRNIDMVNSVDKLHVQGKTLFVAVGTLHMIGDNGLPALLQSKGYEVKPIFFK